MKKENILILIALVITALGLWWYLGLGGKEAVKADRVSASDQAAVDWVVIGSVFLEEPGYVVIHGDAGGVPGEILGNGELLVGQQENVVVFLKREAKQGETLYAMLHRDNGNGSFEFPGEDGPVTTATGRIILSSFVILQG